MSLPVTKLGIVVAADGSAPSNAAVCWAARDAAGKNLPLTVFHAVTMPTTTWAPIACPESLLVQLEDEGRRVLAHAVKVAEEAIPGDAKVTVQTGLVYSAPAPALIKMSDDADMMVVGSSGRGLMARGLLGSVSSSVVRHASCPVAVIRDEDPTMPDPQTAPVLVGIDGSPASELATAIAFDEASRRGVDLVALHAWSDVAVFELPGLEWSAVVSETERNFAERLAGWQERYPGVTVHRVVVFDRPAPQLIQRSESAQLVVVGSHGRGGLDRMLLGSVSNAVLHGIRTPVIVARPSVASA